MIPCHTTQFVVIRLCDGSCLVVIQHIEPDEVNRIIDSQQLQLVYLILEGTKKKKLQEGMRGGGGSIGPPSIFQIFKYSHGAPYWFPWQPQQHNDVTSGRHLGFSNFQFFFIFKFKHRK